jgi:hypothetical protein
MVRLKPCKPHAAEGGGGSGETAAPVEAVTPQIELTHSKKHARSSCCCQGSRSSTAGISSKIVTRHCLLVKAGPVGAAGLVGASCCSC